MKKETAAKIIESYEVNSCGYCHQGGPEVEEAFRMAADALKNPARPSKVRLIDADALMEVYTRHEFSSDMGDAIEILDNFSTMDAVPVRHGKWTRENNYGIWKCSECGCKINRKYPLKGNIWNYYYCPNCGAKMDEERKEE